jgi:hypothetical protein
MHASPVAREKEGKFPLVNHLVYTYYRPRIIMDMLEYSANWPIRISMRARATKQIGALDFDIGFFGAAPGKGRAAFVS